MRHFWILAAWFAALPLHPPPLAAQERTGEAEVLSAYQAVDASVVRIRTVADLEYSALDPRSGLRSMVKKPLSVYGTGVVIGRVWVDDRWEYLVVTNHHVADVSNYVVHDGRSLRENKRNTRAEPLVHEESYVVTEERDEVLPTDIRLVEIGRNVRGDMALLQTVHAQRELVPFTGTIGYRDGEVASGAAVVTSGFPYSGGKIVALGRVLDTDRLHDLGTPHVDFTVDLPVERGQSGSPVFLVETVEHDGKQELRFSLIGLLHAAERDTRFMVPYALWRETLEQVPAELSARLSR